MPGLDVKPLLAELRGRVAEELDYRREAAAQQAFAACYAGDADVCVPGVVASATTCWSANGWTAPAGRIIAGGTAAQRDRAGIMMIRFLFSGRAGPAPARRSAPGQLPSAGRRAAGCARLRRCRPAARGLPAVLRQGAAAHARRRRPGKLEDEFRSHGYLRDGVGVDLTALRAFLVPLAEPSRAESFRFSREWLRTETVQASALRSSSVLRRLNLPPSYVLIHRVLASGLGVLCQLECEAPFRAEVLRWMPGYADPASPRRSPSQPVPGQLPQPDPRRQPPPTGTPDPRRQLPPTGIPGPRRQPGRRSRQAPCRQPQRSRGKIGTAGPASRPARPEQITQSTASWAGTASIVVRAVEGHHG